MRIIIENYVSFIMIKKYKKKKIWEDWYLWSNYTLINKVDDEIHYTKMKEIYDKLCTELNVTPDHINNTQSYGWLKRVIKLKNYSFKSVCDLVDPTIYKDFSYLSRNIHNNDIYSKTSWIDMTNLTRSLFLLYDFTDKIIIAYNPYIIRRKNYNYLKTHLLESLDKCCDYQEETLKA